MVAQALYLGNKADLRRKVFHFGISATRLHLRLLRRKTCFIFVHGNVVLLTFLGANYTRSKNKYIFNIFLHTVC